MELKFEVDTVDYLEGLHSYMNTLVNTNPEVVRFQLRRVTHFWGFREGNFIYYMLACPWVHTIVNDNSNVVLPKKLEVRPEI